MDKTDLWIFKYQPKSFNEMVLSDDLKVMLSKCVSDIPNLFISGPPGTGKSCAVDILLKETKCDYLKINCSDENSVDDIRTKVKNYATSLGLTKIKIIYMNECDDLSQAAQKALRQLQEDVQKITRFIYVCNYPNRVIDPIKKSRTGNLDFSNPPKKDIFKRCLYILEQEKVKTIDKKLLAELINKYYPDIRGIISNMQLNCINGKFLSLTKLTSDCLVEIFNNFKKKNINEVRKILKSNYIDYTSLYEHFFEKVGEFKLPGDAIILIGDYLYRDSIVANKEINFMAMLVKMIKKGIV